MLFNSYGFIFAFLPLSLLGYYGAAWLRRSLARVWLVLCSLFFYGWWNPQFVLLLIGSIAFNYSLSQSIDLATSKRPHLQAALLTAGIGSNLLLLFFYKYLFSIMSFFGLVGMLPAGWAGGIILPLGISFFTFTQIGYLVDASQGLVKRHGVLDYVLFVTFFPHLIAGPILHNREIIPQFREPATYRFRAENLSVGFSIFVIGLCKKVIIADPFGQVAEAGFLSPSMLSTYGAWQTVLSYALQLYFDFSGYSDMAIGIARMFGIIFPLNFNSPYKSRSIIDFWQRWHMTLTRYLTLYLFNPVALWVTRRRMARGLGTSRQAARTPGGFASMIVLPLFFTMTLAGIWHGAGLQFLIFGLLHAVYLSINHAWRVFHASPRSKAAKHLPPAPEQEPLYQIVASVGLTFAAVLIAQIFFRAASPGAAVSMISGLLGGHPTVGEILVPTRLFGWTPDFGTYLADNHLITLSSNAVELKKWVRILVGFAMVWCLPNTQQIMVEFGPALGSIRPFPWPALRWQPSMGWGVAIGALMIAGLFRLDNPSRFLYFQF